MLIGIDASRANRKHKTGTEWYSYYLIRWLAKLDDKNQYILFTDEPLTGGLLDLSTTQYFSKISKEKIEFDEHGYQIIKCPFNNFKAKILKWPFKYFWTQGRLSIEMLKFQVDVLFVPAHTLPFIHPSKSIVTIHDIGFEREARLYQTEHIVLGAKKFNPMLNLLVKIFTGGKYTANNIDYLRWSTEYALKNAYKIITVSNYTKKDMESFYNAPADKIAVIYNGYNTNLYCCGIDRDKIDGVLKKYGINGPYLFYVGRIERKKNIPVLIEAFSVLRENNKDIKHKLVLCGDASYGYDETKYMIEEFGLENEVIMTGWLPEEELPFLFKGADAFVFPSIYEGFGIPLLQAMACGIPIAASDATSIPEIVDEAALLFNPNNVHDIANALEEIIINKDLRAKLIAASEIRIKDFSWKKCAQETLNLINGLVVK